MYWAHCGGDTLAAIGKREGLTAGRTQQIVAKRRALRREARLLREREVLMAAGLRNEAAQAMAGRVDDGSVAFMGDR